VNYRQNSKNVRPFDAPDFTPINIKKMEKNIITFIYKLPTILFLESSS
jgi:hypothetical protein